MLRKFQQLLKDVRDMSALRRDLNRQMQSMQMDLDVIKANGVNVHVRLDLANTRTAHVEHYLGLRQHKFTPSDQMWGFFQSRDDIQKGKRPVSMFHEQSNAKLREQKTAGKHGAAKRAA
jgi:hypothetical protein